MSDNQKDKAITDRVIIGNFFRTEYIKRHIEEYDTNAVDAVLKIRNKISVYGIDSVEFKLAFKLAAEKYASYKNNIPTYDCPETQRIIECYKEFFDYENTRFTHDLETLYEISKKYDIAATEILYPIDMSSIFGDLKENTFSPTISYPFTDCYAPLVNVDLRHAQPSFHYDITKPIDSSTSSRISADIAITRLNLDQEMLPREMKILKAVSSQDAVQNFRTSSTTSRAIGIHIWDQNKKEYKPAAEYIDIYKSVACNNKDCDSCETDISKCQKDLRDAYKIAYLCIKNCRIDPTDARGESAPPQSPHSLPRYPLSWPNESC